MTHLQSALSNPAAPREPMLPRELTAPEMALFMAAGTRREVRAGEVIFSRGEGGRSMYVIGSGEIRLQFDDGVVDKRIGPNGFFGELAMFIGRHARVADAVAVEASVLHSISHEAFEDLLLLDPLKLALFMRRSFAYLVASEQGLITSLKRRNEDLMVTLDSLRQTQAQLSTAQRLVQTDELTGLCNRRGLYLFLEQLQSRQLPDTELGLLLIDIDRFKQINDCHGHLLGDHVLRAIAEVVQRHAAPTDLACRLGGDEFALLAQISGEEALHARAKLIIDSVRALQFPVGQDRVQVSVSIGANLCSRQTNWAIWYSDTDCLLYDVKGRGGDAWSTQPDIDEAG